ncbi:hypothetical protein GPALN_007876 [Globodera pallida]|nr:hypothetical protein GPALN_007876 [Globodera pallida]
MNGQKEKQKAALGKTAETPLGHSAQQHHCKPFAFARFIKIQSLLILNASILTEQKERRNTAFHEAGHAVAAIVLARSRVMTQFTIRLCDQACMLLARGAAAMKNTGTAQGCKEDQRLAEDVARRIGLATGAATEAILEKETKRAKQLVINNSYKIKKVAAALLKQESIERREMFGLIGPPPDQTLWKRIKALFERRGQRCRRGRRSNRRI